MSKTDFISLPTIKNYSEVEMIKNTESFYNEMNRRRTVREFSSESIRKEIIENCIKTAGTAPSGANKQPWYFVVVSDPEIKKEIRIAAEREEKSFYNEKAPKEWLNALEPFGTDENKPFLETAPYLIVIFEQKYKIDKNGEKEKHYYTSESVGIATGLLITALHRVGLATLTHTPSPMKFLNKILNRPDNEKPYLVLVVGYPAKDTKVPNIKRKTLFEISEFK
ncbi:MAG: nitroreductase family protein [Calditrichia bacterium]|nr:nitroreductase family protein [Calditrichia bacterium]